MLCENAYYPDGDKSKKLNCKKMDENPNPVFGNRCPLIYFCKINNRFENTLDISGCVYRESKDDRQ